MTNSKSHGIWDASECALLLMDYQENISSMVFEPDRRFIELNARTLANAALAFKIPVILSTVAVKMGVNKPTIPSLKSALPNVYAIDRTSMNSWEDPTFLAAVKATGRKRLVMAGIVTSVCLAYPAVAALADGYDVCFVEDAVGDTYKEMHDTAVLRLAHAGAVPKHDRRPDRRVVPGLGVAFRRTVQKNLRSVYGEIAALRKAPEHHEPHGIVTEARA